MSAESFDKWYVRAREYERGHDDDPRDPGGRTAEGITQREYDVWRAKHGLPKQDVFNISEDEVRIFYKLYWDRVRGDELPAGIDFVAAEGSLNSGPSQSAKWLQRALKMNNVDGEIGPATIAAANADTDNDLIVADYCARRLAFMKGLKTWGHFGKGWSARVANSLKCGQALAQGSVPPDPVALRQLGGAAKASPLSIKQPLIPVSTVQVGNAVGVVGSTASTIAAQAQPLADVAPIFQKVFIGLTMVSIAAGGLVFFLDKIHKSTADGSATTPVDPDADADAPIVPIIQAPVVTASAVEPAAQTAS
jgi:lysozyme family protein